MRKTFLPFFLLLINFFCVPAFAAGEVHMANGDRITGDVIFEDEEKVIVQTESLGELSIKRSFIHHVVKVKPKPLLLTHKPTAKAKGKQLPARAWRGEISPGYNRRTGNTRSSDLYLNGRLSKKTKEDEAELRGDMFYSSQNHRMAAQRYYGVGRYANNFGMDKKWNIFGKTEGDHDRFANIDYRVTPSAGVGYKFSDKPDWKFLTELGAGVTVTAYRDRTPDRTELVLVPRLYAERKLFERLRFSQDLTMYPSLTDGGFRLRFIDDYNSDPGLPGVKKNDTRLISSLVYSF